MTALRHEHYDVIVIGGGIVGGSLACALTAPVAPDARLLLVEAAPIAMDAAPAQPGYDMRSTVLSAGSVDCFRTLDLWDGCRTAAEPIREIHVSDQGRFGSVRLDSADEGVEALGYVVANEALGRALNAALPRREQLELCAPAQVHGLVTHERGMRVDIGTEDGTHAVTASLVVLADGGRSGLAERLGIEVSERAYEQGAVIANVSFTHPHAGVAYERFTPKGPLALLPLPDHGGEHRAALVWTQRQDEIPAVLALEEEELLAALQDDFGDRLGRFTRIGECVGFALRLRVAREQIRPALALLGNAAHTLHPVAGQGFNLALRDTMLLAANIRESLAAGQDPGDYGRLRAYLEGAGGDQRLTIGFSDYMTRLFSSDRLELRGLRRVGMACVDLLPPVKHALSRQAMGMAGARTTLP